MPASPAQRPLTAFQRIVGPLAVALLAALLPVGLPAGFLASAAAADPCAPLINAVACENSKPGADPNVWDIDGAGDESIQGYATEMSVNAGQPVRFKVDTAAPSYTIAIYRTGWYQGLGARKIADVTPSAPRQTQPQCLRDAATELYDCGTWAVSATWQVPATAVSGVYFALLTRPDTGDSSHITFVVRNDSSHSDVVFQTSDTTWQAYNSYGGSDFYEGAANGRAYKISYNRPINTRNGTDGRDFFFSNEYPLVRFLEKNGYDVSYISGLDTDRSGALLLNHKVFLSVGHDEYWSGPQRSNVEAARNAGVNLQFLSGNEMYWRVRFEPSPVDGAAHRTITSYKETWANGKIDPSPGWTGTWRDPRYASQANGGGLPENALTGTMYMSNYTDMPIRVSSAEGKSRLWRNTSLASLAAGSTAALAEHTVGYESDEDLDNGFRPAGLIRLSTSTGTTPEYLRDYGNTVSAGTTTHNLTLYKAASGALVFGAGTVQWTWGLDQEHDGPGAPADPRIQQAQINLLADMGAQPGTRDTALAAAARSTDTTGPTVAITAPADNAGLVHGTSVTASGTATDVGGIVAGVEVSTDGGTSWHPAQGKQNWTYTYIQKGLGTAALKVRAVDDSANIGAVATRTAQLTGPYSVFGQQIPAIPDAQDGGAYELGLKITPTVDGFISGVRFYKSSANTGTHNGSLWNSAGQRLATAAFTAETASGWQKVSFGQAVAVSAGSTYTVSYTAPNGHYASTNYQWVSFGSVEPPLTVAGGFGSPPAGVYGVAGSHPTSSYNSGNYFVDALFELTDNTPLSAGGQWPLPGSSSVPQGSTVGAIFSKPVTASTVSLTLKDANGAPVAGASAYDPVSRKATFTPAAPLALATTFTATLTGTTSSGVTLSSGGSWFFTTVVSPPPPGSCPCSFYDESVVPAIEEVMDGVPLTLGIRFSGTTSGTVTGVKFYKSAGNTGTHTGYLFTGGGQQLASVTFANESTSGWQTAFFDQPVSINANAEYVVAYKSLTGAYSATGNGFGNGLSVGNLRTYSDAGAYSYSGDFPGSHSSASYLVDVVAQFPDPPFTAGGQQPLAGSSSVALDSTVSTVLSKPATASTVKITLTGPGTTSVAGTTAYDPATNKATFTPTAALAPATTFTATLTATSTTGQQLSAGSTWTFTTVPEPRIAGACPCTLFQDTVTPGIYEINDGVPLTLGVRFSSTTAGTITGVRFYKAASNTGTHTGTLFTASGQQLATITFTNETTAGWQTATFNQPVPINANTEYVAAYTTPGTYSATSGGHGTALTSGPLRTTDGAGAFTYSLGFPGNGSNASYLLDVVFQAADLPLTAGGEQPLAGSSSVALDSTVSTVLSKPATASTVKITLTGPGTTSVAGTTAYDPATNKATFTPTAALAPATTFTATLTATSTTGQQLSAGSTWTFTTVPEPRIAGTCPCTLFQDTVTPGIYEINDGVPLTLGVRFSSTTAGTITGVRFYKAASNTGTHTGTLFTASGQQLATITFTNETTAGWQTATFNQPVPINANTEYVAAYTTPGTYSATPGGHGTALTSGPLRTTDGAGAFTNGAGFPGNGSSASYLVDVVAEFPDPPFTAGGQQPLAGSSSVALDSTVSTVLSKPATASTVKITLTGPGTTSVAGITAYDPATNKATFTPTAALAPATTFTATLTATSTTGQQLSAGSTWTFTTVPEPRIAGTCPCTLFQDTVTPATRDIDDVMALTLGVRFSSTTAGTITGVRFYKAASNTGTHTGKLYTAGGQELATITFTNETTAGWQTATFNQPVPINANTEYTAAYTTPNGTYSATTGGNSTALTSGPLQTAPGAGAFTYSLGFPGNGSDANYLVDVVFQAAPPAAPPAPQALTVGAQTPAPGAVNVPRDAKPSLTVSAALRAGSALQATTAGTSVAGTSAISADSKTITFSPASLLAANTQVTVRAVNVISTDGAALPPTSWQFTTANPANQSMFATVNPASSISSETRAIELGVSFRTTRTGLVTAIRFHKGALNTGTHYGSLWTAAGARLVRVAFTNETLSGWQTVTLGTPILLAANTDYVVSYNAPRGRYSFTTNYFSQARTVGYLTAAATRNGLYRLGTGTAVPNLTSNATNYFVDVVFSPAS